MPVAYVTPLYMAQMQLLSMQLQAVNLINFSSPESRQVANASNRNIIVGNIGLVTTGPQTATPVNVGH